MFSVNQASCSGSNKEASKGTTVTVYTHNSAEHLLFCINPFPGFCIIKGTVKTIQDAGMPAEVIESETDEYMEVVIRLPKKDLNEQQNIAR